jgi:hypothetical protein
MNQEGRKNYLDDYFKDRLFDYESDAPDDMWVRIDGQIKRKRTTAMWTIIGSLAASILIMISVGIGYYFGSKHSIQSENKYKAGLSNKPENSAISKENGIKTTSTDKTSSLSTSDISMVMASNKSAGTGNERNTFINIGPKENSNPEIKSHDDVSDRKFSKQVPTLNKLESRRPIFQNNIQKEKILFPNKNIDMITGYNENPTDISTVRLSKKTFRIGGNAGPFYSAWNVNKNNGVYLKEYVNSVEKPVIAFSGGVNINMETSRWRFESGIYYSRSNLNLDKVSANLIALNEDDIVRLNSSSKILITNTILTDAYISRISKKDRNSFDVANTVDNPKSILGNEYSSAYFGSNNTTYLIVRSDNTDETQKLTSNLISSMNQQNEYIEIPIIAAYKIVDRKIDIFFSGGISTNILLRSKVYMKLNNDIVTIGTDPAIKKYTYAGIIGFAFEMPLARKIYFRFEPRFNYYISSIDKDNNASIHPYSFGALSGVSIHF